jgi:protein-S-isoprenylcysteine O-methyltransferase Ste14
MWGLIPAALGVYLNLKAVDEMARHNTPHNFDPSKHVVTSGVFKYSRNPIYLGMVLILAGLASVCGNLIGYVSIVFFYLVVRLKFIPMEEDKMQRELGKAYLDYKSRVRRWV